MTKFRSWISELGDHVINPGTPLGASMTVSANHVADGSGSNPMSGFSVIRADDMSAALEMAGSCPHLDIGGTVVVSEMVLM